MKIFLVDERLNPKKKFCNKHCYASFMKSKHDDQKKVEVNNKSSIFQTIYKLLLKIR